MITRARTASVVIDTSEHKSLSANAHHVLDEAAQQVTARTPEHLPSYSLQ